MARYIAILLLSLAWHVAFGQSTHNVTVVVGQPAECATVLGLEESNLFKIYPNPASSSFKIESDLNEGQMIVSDLKGREVLKGQLSDGNLEVDVSLLKPGIYIIHLRSGKMSDKIKIQIQ